MGDVKEKVLYILKTNLEIVVTSLDQELELGCSDKVDLLMGLADDLQVIVLDEDIEGLDTPKKIIDYVEKKIKDEKKD